MARSIRIVSSSNGFALLMSMILEDAGHHVVVTGLRAPPPAAADLDATALLVLDALGDTTAAARYLASMHARSTSPPPVVLLAESDMPDPHRLVVATVRGAFTETLLRIADAVVSVSPRVPLR